MHDGMLDVSGLIVDVGVETLTLKRRLVTDEASLAEVHSSSQSGTRGLALAAARCGSTGSTGSTEYASSSGDEDSEIALCAHAESPPAGAHTFFFVKPRISYGLLLMSKDIQQKLLTTLDVFPAFLDILHLFGRKHEEINEDYAVYRQEIVWREEEQEAWIAPSVPEAFEICYNFRYVVQRKGNVEGEELIWTTRKMGVYSKFVPATNTTTWIPVYPPDEAIPRLEEVFTSDSKRRRGMRHHIDIHLLLMKTASQDWLPFINHLDKKLIELDKKTYMWRPKPGSTITNEHRDSDSELELEDTQRVQRFKIELLTIIHALDVNLANIASLRRGIESFRRKTKVYITDDLYKQYDEDLEDLHILMSQHRVRVKNLLQRAESLFSLIITIIPYIFARRENTLMFRLSEKATQYAKSMKVITIVCMLYLPPSVIAGVFGMDFFHPSWDIAIMWAIFICATVILAASTIGLWLWWEHRCLRDEEGGGGKVDSENTGGGRGGDENTGVTVAETPVGAGLNWWRRTSRLKWWPRTPPHIWCRTNSGLVDVERGSPYREKYVESSRNPTMG
ncbi:hypothetical protein BZA05DRAFT_398419 [Tricharina praecox]|uniref:uncharacterized protein n=1 Tax=Tricharina praecox TaxID=43433 RepID=UPI00221F94EA|nr:uncharacterized protein BZA05DRAFT_398419 [Tricharina praecox]KAI5851949.1 hypothetical protein BZA05DRAFT_398419 [Tricharina praecox]